MSNDYEIFKGKSLSSLFQDIYENQNYNRKQLDVLTRNITSMIKDGDTAVQIVPMIKEYLEINVRNDELLVKLASIVQKIISTENKGESESEFGLSEIEKQEIMNTILEHDTKDLQETSDKIRKDIEKTIKCFIRVFKITNQIQELVTFINKIKGEVHL